MPPLNPYEVIPVPPPTPPSPGRRVDADAIASRDVCVSEVATAYVSDAVPTLGDDGRRRHGPRLEREERRGAMHDPDVSGAGQVDRPAEEARAANRKDARHLAVAVQNGPRPPGTVRRSRFRAGESR
jgi:hypothetical protein